MGLIMEENNKPVVLGLGNLIFQDEGIGIHVINQLMKGDMAKRAELIDGGTDGLLLLNTVETAENLLVIDAIDGLQKAGTIYRMEDDEIPILTKKKLSAHQLSFQEVLALAQFRGKFPKSLVLIGVQPKTLDWGTELTPDISKAIPKVIKLVHDQLEKWATAEPYNLK